MPLRKIGVAMKSSDSQKTKPTRRVGHPASKIGFWHYCLYVAIGLLLIPVFELSAMVVPAIWDIAWGLDKRVVAEARSAKYEAVAYYKSTVHISGKSTGMIVRCEARRGDAEPKKLRFGTGYDSASVAFLDSATVRIVLYERQWRLQPKDRPLKGDTVIVNLDERVD